MNPEKTNIILKVREPIKTELTVFEESYRQQLNSDVGSIQPLFDHVGRSKGKHIRPIFFFLSQGLHAPPLIESVSIAVLLELLHSATLVHDDVVDHSSVRRGRETVNSIWGNQVSVLLGDFLFAQVLALCADSLWDGVMKIIAEAAMAMGRGELRQNLASVDESLSEDIYFQWIEEKTASLFEAAGELAGLIQKVSGSNKKNLKQLGLLFGMAFQIRDDILDYTGSPDALGKPAGQDMVNNKITLPLIYAFQNASEKDKQQILQNLLNPDSRDHDRMLHLIHQNDGIKSANLQLEKYSEKALKLLHHFPDNPYRKALEMLIAYDLERGE